jgi:biopolymer transport protein TolR
MAVSVGRRTKRRGFVDINVTPLVDVMLVLLIVFMVTAPLLSTSLRIELPEVQASNQPIKDAKLVVSISKEEKIFLGEDEVTANLEQVLKSNPRIQSEHELYIRADKEARYRFVARAVAAARAAGVTSLNLLVDPEVEK